MSLSGHQSSRMKSDTWLTPPELLRELGAFDLDPCCPPNMPWRTAKVMWTNDFAPLSEGMIAVGGLYNVRHDGLLEPWFGRVWLNPPFGNRAAAWLEKLAKHGNGIALIPARTETRMFYESVWAKADAVLFLRGRPHFHRADGHRADGNSGAPIALVAYGEYNAHILADCGLGVCVHWSKKGVCK